MDAALEIPASITHDQYDKITRQLWEIKQRMKGIDATVLNSVELDKLFDRQNSIEQELSDMKHRMTLTMQAVTLLMNIANYPCVVPQKTN